MMGHRKNIGLVFLLVHFAIVGIAQTQRSSGQPMTAASVRFSPYATSMPVPIHPRTLQIDTKVGEGQLRLITGSRLYLSVHLRTPQGEVKNSQTFLTGTVSNIELGDLNSDGRSDVAITYDWTSEDLWGDSLGIFLQAEDGSMQRGGSHYVGFRSSMPTIGDFNNDGRADVAVSQKTISAVLDSFRIFYQDGSGALSYSKTYPAMQNSGLERAFEAGDFNGDGLLDLVAADAPGRRGASVYLQQSDGTMMYSGSYLSPYAFGEIAVGDLNGDGRTDFVASIVANEPNASLYFFFQNSNGEILSTPLVLPAYHIPESMEVGDIDMDGRDDLVVVHGGWERITVYRQTSNSSFDTFAFPYPYCSHIRPRAMDIADVNNDHRLDIVLVDAFLGVITLLNETVTSVARSPSAIPLEYGMSQNYPNPFNPSTRIPISMADDGSVQLAVYDALGRRVNIIYEGTLSRGNHTVEWLPSLPSGVYFVRLTVSGTRLDRLQTTFVKKAILAR